MGSAATSYLIVRVGDRRLAFDAGEIAEILPLLPLWRPPTLPRPLAGFATVAGATLPVLDPLPLFGMAARSGAIDLFAHIVRPRNASGTRPCLLVDRAEALLPAGRARIGPVSAEASLDGLIAAEIATDDGVAHLMSFDRLLDSGERERVAALTEQASDRAAAWADA